MPTSNRFFRSTALTDLTLRVRHMKRVSEYYRETLGFQAVAEAQDRVELSPSGSAPALIVLEHAPGAPSPPPGTAGLFHVAFLYPDRAALGRILRRLEELRVRLGAADHGVSEALYLHDPEGNGIELYADRPESEWPPAQGHDGVTMISEPLNFASLLHAGEGAPETLLPPETRIGHIHLKVSDLARAEAFYADELKFPVRQRSYPGALFLGRDGYHHHIGANTWNSRLPAVRGALGLARFTMSLAECSERTVVDPDGIEIVMSSAMPIPAPGGPAPSGSR